MFDCEIINGVVVTSAGRQRASIAVHDGRIAAISPTPLGGAARVIDAADLVVMPGMVDQHVHFMDPGDTTREDFPHGSAAAAVGGITTVIEHTHSHPVLTAADLEAKAAYLADRSVVDFGLAAHIFPETIAQVPALWAAGAALCKVFTCATHGVPALQSDDLLRCFRVLAETGARALVHCEDDAITADNEERLHAALRTDYGVIVEWRSWEAELVAVNSVALLARLTGAEITIAHASQPEVISLAARERQLGAHISVETCPQYLTLTAAEVSEHGPTRKCTPPPRDPPAQAQLWDLLAHDAIDLISTDHAPSTLAQKQHGTIWECHFGLPGVETTLPILLDAASIGKVTLEQIVRRYSEMPARLLGLWPRKGALVPGADADLVLVDPTARYALSDANMLSKAGWTPYAGRQITGRPVMTMVRGTVVAEHGAVSADVGTGRWVRRASATA